MVTPEELKAEAKKVSAIAIFTLLMVLMYGIGAIYALFHGDTDFKGFSAALGPITGLLVGYWVRGSNSSSN